MATLTVAARGTSDDALQSPKVALRDWLAGHWAVLFSNPEHFAPHPTTPMGFITLLAEDFVTSGAKPIMVTGHAGSRSNWLDYAGADCTDIVIAHSDRDDQVVNLSERALALTIERLTSPFVIVIDANGRCRSTFMYQATAGDRGRSIEEVLSVVQVLRSGTSAAEPPDYGKLATA
jgi:alkyl hydroperoxide reductase subunit AhpC